MISVILPTYNEAANLPTLVDFLDGALKDQPHEIIVVDDDSPDGTWRVAENLATKYISIRVIRRRGKRGLSSAVVDGFDAAIGDILVVMDADGQHDAGLLPQLVGALRSKSDIAIGSRYIEGGSVGDWVTDRRIISSIGTFFARSLSRIPVSDPLGGFFAMKKSLYRLVRPHLRPSGFKILLEILANVPSSTQLIEIPLTFRMRLHGESKLSLSVHLAYALQVVRLALLRPLHQGTRFAGAFFWIATIALFVFLALRAIPLAPLRHADIRKALRSSIQNVADHQGWLLSDISILHVRPSSASIRYHEHGRSFGKSMNCELTYDPPSLACDENI